MNNNLGLLLGIGFVGLAVYYLVNSDNASASSLLNFDSGVSFDPYTGDSYYAPDTAQSDVPADTSATESLITIDQKISAFLAMIRQFESSNNYGSNIPDGNFSKHPGVSRTVKISGKNIITTAAGAYQFISATWNRLQKKLGLPDFSPESQDVAAYQLLAETGAINALEVDDITQALYLASSQWAALPGSQAGQNPKSLDVAMNTYNQFLAA